MSARSDVRQLASAPTGSVSAAAGGSAAAAQHAALYAAVRHPQHPSLNQRHPPGPFLNSALPSQTAQDASAKLRAHQQVAVLSSSSAVTLVGSNPTLSISGSPALARAPSSSYAPAYNSAVAARQEQLVKYVPPFPNSPSAAAAAVAAVQQQQSHHSHTAAAREFVRTQDLRSSSGLSGSSSADIRSSGSGQAQLQQNTSRISIRQPPYQASHHLFSSNDPTYLEAIATQARAAVVANMLPIHPALSAGHAPATVERASNSNSDPQPISKRPRMDIPHAATSTIAVGGGGAVGGEAISRHHVLTSGPAHATPLTIDTREAVKESGYHPQVEQISPTGPEPPVGSNEQDDFRSTKDELLQRITRVDREIAKAESHIGKLTKKLEEQQDLQANKQNLSDTNEEPEEERPKNQSIAQIIYADNRKRAKASHLALAKFGAPNDLPLYNQPADTDIYFENRRIHAKFKKRLVEHFRKKSEQKEERERHITKTYAKMMAAWMRKVDKIENSKKRREKEAKARELYEKVFPELRKQREDKERDHRLGSRGAVRSEADMEDVIERLQEQELEDKKMHSYAVIPPLLLSRDERKRKFTNNNGMYLNSLKEYEERKFLNTWTESERDIFREKYLHHPKNFGQIAQFLERKSIKDCVQYYYLSKKTENYKQLMRKVKIRRGKRTQQNDAGSVSAGISTVTGVMTRNRRGGELTDKNNDKGEDSTNVSNRSTPQPNSLKQEIKSEVDDDSNENKRGTRNKANNNESSDEEDQTQTGKSGPNMIGVKCSNCPIPSCTTTRGRLKGRLRHMPKKLQSLSKENKEAVINELQIPIGTKKCCSACFHKISRKINNIVGSSNCNSPADMASSKSNTDGNSNNSTSGNGGPSDSHWTEEEIELLKSSLKSHGGNWQAISEKLSHKKTAEQCKKFFYNYKKKHGLDKLVAEFKKANQAGGDNQPPTLSSDEESGSSTSSCDEEANSSSAVNHNPARPNNINKANDVKAPIKTEATTIKPEAIKTEIKVEDEVASVPSVPSIPSVGMKPKEDDYDSSATISADERDTGDANQARPLHMYPGHRQDPRLMVNSMSLPRGSFPAPTTRSAPFPVSSNTSMRPPQSVNGPRDTITVKELMINVIERSLSTPGSPQNHSSVGANAASIIPANLASGSNSMQPAASPTIKTLLENSDPTPPKGSNPIQRSAVLTTKGNMAPPPTPNDCETLDLSMPRRRETSPPPSVGHHSQSQYREPHLVHPHARSSPNVKSEYPSSTSSTSTSAPPPAHAGNKVKTNPDPYYRGDARPPQSTVVFGSEGRPVVTPPNHIVHRTAPSPSHQRSSANISAPSSRAPTVQYIQRHPTHSIPAKAPQASPKMGVVGRPLSIQTGSITQGTPVNQQIRYDSLVKVIPPEKPGSITHGTPVTYDKKHQQVINVSEHPSRHERASADYYHRRTVSPGYSAYPSTSTSTQSRSSSYDSPLSSRQVLINDYAIARSGEMQRRPESRDHRSISPSRLLARDQSPRPRIDPRAAPDTRAHIELRRETRIDPRSYDIRAFDPRVLPDHRGDPKAEIRALDQRSDPRLLHDIRSDPRVATDPRSALEGRGGDPRALLEHRSESRGDIRSDPRIDPRADLRITHEVHRRSTADPRTVLDPRSQVDPRTQIDPRSLRTMSQYPHSQGQLYMLADGKYVHSHALRDYPAARPRSPIRSATTASTPPPQRASAAVLQRGGITSGKPVVAQKPGPLGNREVEIYRTNAEVTISKTNSPRQSYNDHNPLASLVDVAVQQPKLPDIKERERLLYQQQLQQNVSATSGAPIRMNYDRQVYDGRLAPPPVSLVNTSTSSSHPSNLVQQVRTERAKQSMYLLQDKEREFPSASSSATITKTTLPSGSATLTPISKEDHHNKAPESKTLTAAKLIENIITHSISTGPPPDGGVIPKTAQFRRNPAEVAALTPQEDAAIAKTNSPLKVRSRSPSLKGEQLTNGPDEGRGNSAPGSRPGSRSSSVAPVEHEGNKDIVQDGMSAEQYWKRRGMTGSSGERATLSTMPAPRSAASLIPGSSDERQITRVAAPGNSPKTVLPPGVEPISPPNERISPSSVPTAVDPMTRFLDARKRSSNSPSDNNGKSDISPLDYVKSKIEEEMRKEQSSANPTASTSLVPTKPADATSPKADDNSKVTNGNEVGPLSSSSKKSEPANLPLAASSAPDSPGSEGEMVIDESVRPDSAGNDPSNNKPPSSSASPLPSHSNPANDSSSTSDTKPNVPNATKPQYEPLSDDE